MAKLVVTSKLLAGLSHELGKQWVTIGRGPGNAFQILEPSISGQHCEVLFRGDELLVRDMRSTNGTYIKGKMISEGVVRPGELFRMGEVELRLEATETKVIPLPGYSSPVKKESTSVVARSSANRSFGAQKLQVLMVDDSMAFLETAAEMFESLANGEWEIHKASAADEALNIVQERNIDIAVIDIYMPMLDGVQLLGMLHRRHPEVKKVILTGMANETHRAQCLTAGAELFLEKPITRDGMRFVFNVLSDLITWKQREGFAGTLQQVGLMDIIQIECLRRSSCVLEIQSAQAHGEIYIETGVIVHASMSSLSGEKALHRLLSLDKGQFHLYPYRQPPERSIQGSWEWLLMESARKNDEEKSARAGDKTTFIPRPGKDAKVATTEIPPIPQKVELPAPKKPALEKVELPDIGDDIVIISTYDGNKWKKVE